MLLGQLLVVLLAAVKRFDGVALQAAESVRGKLGALRRVLSSGESLAE